MTTRKDLERTIAAERAIKDAALAEVERLRGGFQDVGEVLQNLLNKIPDCRCSPAYRLRKRRDPCCFYHEIGGYVIEPAKALVASVLPRGEPK